MANQFDLRPLLPADAPNIAELIGDWEVVRWLSMPPYPYAQSDAEEFLARLPAAAAVAPWVRHDAITVEDRFAGIIGIDKRSVGPNLGFWLGRPYWGRGIMSAAARRVVVDFFAMSAEPLLTSGYFPGNERSGAIQRRLGFAANAEATLFNRPQGKHLPHVDTLLTRARFAGLPERPTA